MNLNNIKRNQLDYLLTDILPNELSDRFTYSHFYGKRSISGTFSVL